MKQKMILALLAAMTLTVGSVGTVFAATNNGGAEVQTSEPEVHTHTWGAPVYVVDQEAVYGPSEWVIDKEAEYEQIKVVDSPAWTEEITENHTICYACEAAGNTVIMDGWGDEQIVNHMDEAHGGMPFSYGNRVIVIDSIYHPEEFHYENGALISPEEGHWTEAPLITPEQGHWEHTCEGCGEIQNSETGEVIKPGTITTPENPGTETPETPDTENPDTETPENPDTNTPTNPDTENPDTEAPVNPGTDTENPSGDNTQNPTEDTEKPVDGNEGSQDQTDQNKTETPQNTAEETTATENKNTDTQDTVKGEKVTQVNTQTETTESNESNEKKSPKTGDPANFIYLATLAGSALTGGTAFGLRKKLQK